MPQCKTYEELTPEAQQGLEKFRTNLIKLIKDGKNTNAPYGATIDKNLIIGFCMAAGASWQEAHSAAQFAASKNFWVNSDFIRFTSQSDRSTFLEKLIKYDPNMEDLYNLHDFESIRASDDTKIKYYCVVIWHAANTTCDYIKSIIKNGTLLR